MSLTKHGAHKIATLLRKYDKDQILNHLEGSEPGINIELAQAKKNLSVSRRGVVPDLWNAARERGSETIDALVLVAIILSHHRLIDAIKSSTARYRFAGTARRGQVLDGKAYTNLAHIIEELGYSIVSVANSYSGWNRCVKQTATMLLPSILAKSSMRGRWA